MNLYDFFGNNHQQRASLVWEQGEFLTIRVSGEYSVCLYSMGNFFAEIWYRIVDNQVDFVRGFKSNALLEPYLELVDLSQIIR
ncbi:hypothetical protein HUW51_09070 [Adhaeribacter swui]|uniref:Uncharacterized protein n=1 Tax=Adhaeribacter swui TaxID=2086471 RepID=A0A7G7G6U1_9BACT|nr:hypothetical protein [Adhaeribacter swui]QNF32875.1 hypothetical protein HUW51_09070 [Adhaeribacter swui]